MPTVLPAAAPPMTLLLGFGTQLPMERSTPVDRGYPSWWLRLTRIVVDAVGEWTTTDYTVVMPVVSIRFSDEPLHHRLKERARRSGVSISTLAGRLIDEGLRTDAHPMVVFQDGPAGRRPVLVGGPTVGDVIGAIVGGDVPVAQRRSRAAELLGVSETLVDAALAYYADFTDDIDGELAARASLADEAEAAWRRRQELLTR